MTEEDFLDVLYESWTDVWGSSSKVTIESFGASKISSLVSPPNKKHPQQEGIMDRAFHERVRQELKERNARVAGWRPWKFKQYRDDEKTWSDLAEWMDDAKY